jgi:hypothetical protein
MAAIKNGKLVVADICANLSTRDQKPAAVKEENQCGSTHLFNAAQPKPDRANSNSEILFTVKALTAGCAAAK